MPLHWAASSDDVEVLDALIDGGADIEAPDGSNDPMRRAIGILGAAQPSKALRPGDWAKIAVDQGVVRTLIPANERDSEKGRERAIGVLLRPLVGETFESSTEVKRYKLRLEGGSRRWIAGKNPHVRYRFEVLLEEELAEDGETEELATERPVDNYARDRRTEDAGSVGGVTIESGDGHDTAGPDHAPGVEDEVATSVGGEVGDGFGPGVVVESEVVVAGEGAPAAGLGEADVGIGPVARAEADDADGHPADEVVRGKPGLRGAGGLVAEPLDGLPGINRFGSIDADQPDLDVPAVEADHHGIAVDHALDQGDGGRS
jgi:hypothetical protein